MKLFNPFAARKPQQASAETDVVDKSVNAEIRIFNTPEDIEGMYAYTPDALLNTPEIKPLIEKIKLAMGSRTELFDKYLYPSIVQVAHYVQKLPASESAAGKPSNVFGHHISVGGLLLHSLETMYFALNDSRLAFFNKGILPKDRDRNLVASRIACGLSGLLHDIGKLNDPVIVTYTEENGLKTEHIYKCVESIPDWLSRVHNLPLEKVYCDGQNQNPPVYIIKSWKKGRTDKHEIIAPFFIRSFITRGTLKLIADTSEQLLQNFITAIDWRVLAADYTGPRDNIIYNIWSVADKTSCIRDSKRATKLYLKPLNSNQEIKQTLINSFNSLTDTGEIAVNQEDQCYIFTHAFVNGGEYPFIVLMRFDDLSMGMFLRVISKASDLYKADVLQDHEPTLENIKKLLEESDLLLPSKSEDGLYSVKVRQDSFKAIAFKRFKDAIIFNGNLYRAQQTELTALTVEFTDGIEPVYTKESLATKDLRCSLVPPKDERAADEENSKTQTNLSDNSVNAESESGDSEVHTLEGESEIQTAPQIVPFIPVADESYDDPTVNQPELSEEDEQSLQKYICETPFAPFNSVEPAIIDKGFMANEKELSDKLALEERYERPQVLEESEIRNFDRAIHDHKLKQKELASEQKKEALLISDTVTEDNADIYHSEREPYYNGLKTDVVIAIKDVCESIADEKVARNLSIQICNRLNGKAFSYIDYITVDNKYAYAAFCWNDNITKDANAVQYIRGFDRCNLFPRRINSVMNNTREYYYFEHVQMIKRVSRIFKLAGIKPIKIKCKDHPYETLANGFNTQELIEYIKHRIINLDKNETLYGCEWNGYAHDPLGRRISKEVIYRCGEEYGSKGLGKIKKLLSITSQITPPYMILDGNELVVGYQRQLCAEKSTEIKPTQEENELLDLPLCTFSS
ncbi:TraI domain-containing protein [Succinivibrio dextrinosolvens]|uniref:TraI domain-containing protein n=1 Tax=Succinivibrio dextrinosolvens TaxID=83771 RepID=UPI00241E4DFE|nr:TraI domain-containing protein [Succinivibrio dextrinosolvens]